MAVTQEGLPVGLLHSLRPQILAAGRPGCKGANGEAGRETEGLRQVGRAAQEDERHNARAQEDALQHQRD